MTLHLVFPKSYFNFAEVRTFIMSRVLQSSIFRALCAIIVGVLLVKYREETVTGITIAIGVLFFVSGMVSIIAYYAARNRKSTVEIFDAEGRPLNQPTPSFPIVGIGSAVLGAVLALMPGTFVNLLMYVLAAILVLGGLNQMFNLASASRWAQIGLTWWVMPVFTVLMGILAFVKPSLIASAPLLIIGLCMVIYGLIELINVIKLYRCRKQFEELESVRHTAEEQNTDAADATEEVETVTAEEINEEIDEDIDTKA